MINQKTLIFSLFIFFFSISFTSAEDFGNIPTYEAELPSESANIYKCTDNDEGIDYNIKGTVVREVIELGDNPTPATKMVFEDTCTNNRTYNKEMNFVREYYCESYSGETNSEITYESIKESPEDRVVKVKDYLCPNGCFEGKCLSKEEEIKNPNIKFKPVKLRNDEYCDGCLKEDVCYPYAYISDGKYCTLAKEFGCLDDSCKRGFRYWWYKIFVRKYFSD